MMHYEEVNWTALQHFFSSFLDFTKKGQSVNFENSHMNSYK